MKDEATVSSEHLLLHARPSLPSPIWINLTTKHILEAGKHLHHTSVKRPHTPLPGMEGVCSKRRTEPPPSACMTGWTHTVQPSYHLHKLGHLPHPHSITRATQSGHLSRQGFCPRAFCLDVLCSKQSSLLLLFYFFPQFSGKLSFATGVPHYG